MADLVLHLGTKAQPCKVSVALRLMLGYKCVYIRVRCPKISPHLKAQGLPATNALIELSQSRYVPLAQFCILVTFIDILSLRYSVSVAAPSPSRLPATAVKRNSSGNKKWGRIKQQRRWPKRAIFVRQFTRGRRTNALPAAASQTRAEAALR